MATVKESETLKLKIERLKFDQSEQKKTKLLCSHW